MRCGPDVEIGARHPLDPFTPGAALIGVLRGWGAEVIFGLPGDGIDGFMEALRARQDEIRLVQVRHEEAAALTACGYAGCDLPPIDFAAFARACRGTEMV